MKLKEGGGFELDLAYFRHHREKVDYSWSGGAPHVGDGEDDESALPMTAVEVGALIEDAAQRFARFLDLELELKHD